MRIPSTTKTLFSLFILAGILFLTTCGKKEGYHSVRGGVWSTSYHITFRGPAQLEDSIEAVLKDVGRSLSPFDSLSLVSKVNRQKETDIDIHFKKVYDISKKINELSGGAFDPTLAPLIRTWGFGQGHTPTADTLRLDSIARFIGLSKTRMEGNRLIKENKNVEFNFSAVAKGYGCDAIGAMFRRNSVKDYLIEIGGEVLASGKSPRQSEWRVGIESPDNYTGAGTGRMEYLDFITLKNEGIATSSNLRNSQVVNGRRRGHIMSVNMMAPVETDVLSATVIAKSCGTADALATAAIVCGAQQGCELLRRAKARGMLVTADSIIYIDWK